MWKRCFSWWKLTCQQSQKDFPYIWVINNTTRPQETRGFKIQELKADTEDTRLMFTWCKTILMPHGYWGNSLSMKNTAGWGVYFLWEGADLFVMQLRPRKWYGVGFGFFDMVLDKILVCELKLSSDCKLQEFIIFSGLQKWSKNEILWDNWCLKKCHN